MKKLDVNGKFRYLFDSMHRDRVRKMTMSLNEKLAEILYDELWNDINPNRHTLYQQIKQNTKL